MQTKEQIREGLEAAARSGHKSAEGGKAAELLRRLPAYREARQIFCDPGPLLAQIRINSLLDGKRLLMPSPGLRDGYYLLAPYQISPRDLSYATTFKGMEKYGRKLTDPADRELALDLLVTAPRAMSRSGSWLGDGLGFFDLSIAAFAAAGTLSENALVCAVAGPGVLSDEEFAPDPWDVAADIIISERGLFEIKRGPRQWPPVFWDRLPRRRIRKITPLWKLYQAGRDAGLISDLLS